MRIVIDTNFIVYSIRYGLFQQMEQPGLRLIIPFQVINELKMLSERAKKYRDREAAKIALQLVKKADIKTAKSEFIRADDAVLDIAAKEKAVIATMDRHLMSRAKKKGLGTITIRDEAYISDEIKGKV